MEYKSTIGADFFSKELYLDENNFVLQIWDTPGTEKYHSMGSYFYRNTSCCALVFDLTNQKSFESLESWKAEFLKNLDPIAPEKYPFVLIGNKSDKKTDRKVSENDIKQFCEKNPNFTYIETSAKDNINIEEAFIKMAKLAFEKKSLEEKKFEDFVPKPINQKNEKSEEEEENEIKSSEKDDNESGSESVDREDSADNKKLKKENKKLKKELEKTKKLLEELKNEKDDINDNKKIIEENSSLKYQISFQQEEINYLKMQLQIYKKEEKKKNNLEIFFVPNDNSYHERFKCSENDKFADIEEKLYKKHEELRNTNNIFIANGIIIKRFKTISENKINDGSIIRIYQS